MYTSTTKFEHYIKSFEISGVFAVRNIKLYVKSLFEKLKGVELFSLSVLPLALAFLDL